MVRFHLQGGAFVSPANLLSDSTSGKPFERIAVFRALQLGDLLCTTPAFRALREELPRARITLIGLSWAAEFASIYDRYFDDFMEFPGYPGLPEREPALSRIPNFLREVQSRNFDLVIQMQGSGLISNSVVSLFGARHLAGYYIPDQFCPDPDRFLPHRTVTHEVWRYLSLVRYLGASPRGEQLDYFVKSEDENELRSVVEDAEGMAGLVSRPFVCIHPGARAAFRCWPAREFAAVADRLAEEGYGIVVTGSKGERDLADGVVRAMKHRAVNMAGRTTLRTLAALIKKSRLLICNDTGVSHLAVALQVPSVVVFTRSEFLGWPPLDRLRHRVVSRLNGPTVEDVTAEAIDLLCKEERWNAPIEDFHLARARELSLLPQRSPP